MKQLKIGVVGVTGRGMIAKSMHQPEGASIVIAGCDTRDEALSIFKKEINPEAVVYKNYAKMLQNPEIDAVVITSPDFTHEEYTTLAFAAGKHVFSEKPMAITTAGCDNMLNAWVTSGKQFMIGFNMRYMNIFRVMKDIIDSGTIGEIKTVWCRHFVEGGGNWYYHDWHGSSKNSTGLLLQKASHDIDMIHWLTGSYTKKVSGMGSLDYYGGDKPNDLTCPKCGEKDNCVEYQHEPNAGKANKMDMCVFRKEIDVEDNSTIMMQLENGIKATYMQCHYTADYTRNYVFIGTEGTVENQNDSTRVIVKLRNRSKRWKNLSNQVYEVKSAEGTHGGSDPLISKDFVEMLKSGKKPIATPLAGRMSVATACAATQSIRNNSIVVEIPPVPEDIRENVY